MKKVFIAFVAFVAMAISIVSCNKIEDDGNRGFMTSGIINGNTLYDDLGLRIDLVDNKYPNGTRGYFAVYYNTADIMTTKDGTQYLKNATAVLSSQYVVFSPESSVEAESKKVDVTKLESFEWAGCVIRAGYLQIFGYDKYGSDSLYHVVYDADKLKDDTLKLVLCNTGTPKSARSQMHVDFDLARMQGLRPWKDSLVVSVIPAKGKTVNLKISKNDFKKTQERYW